MRHGISSTWRLMAFKPTRRFISKARRTCWVRGNKDATTSLDTLVADHIFKSKSRDVSLWSILGEDAPARTRTCGLDPQGREPERRGEDENDNSDAKRNIQKEWF